MLPQRLVLSRCYWQYRGEGCGYEYASQRTFIHNYMSLPSTAPPVGTNNNELVADILNGIAGTD